MTERWWAPQRATLEPDAVVKVIFDTPGDVATTLLGAHRAGAAAVETVAKGAVPSEMGLVKAMAAARERFAPAMVESLATVTGSGSYAGLLARDVLDAAEVGALDLFRTCVAKGISPPLAAQRAGAVYGVPMREMGRYTPLATDPRANPLALADAADRAMLTYFDKISKTETFESVAKATPPKPVGFQEPERPHAPVEWDPTEHPRDGESGEFVRIGGVTYSVAPEKVETAPVERPQRAQRVQRTQRVQRQVRQMRQTVTPPSSGVTRPGSQVQRPRGQVVRPRHSIEELAELNKDVAPALVPAPRLGQRQYDKTRHNDAMDYLGGEERQWEFHPDQVAIPLDSIVARDLRAAMPGENTSHLPKIFRLGHLTEIAGEPEFLDSPEAGDALTAYSVQYQKENPGYSVPKTWLNPGGNDKAMRDYQKNVMARGDRNEKKFIQVANDYKTGEDMLVHLQPDEENAYNDQRVELEIDEFVLMDGFMGEVVAGGNDRRHPKIEMDPDQTYRISKKAERFYDRERHMFVNRWALHLVREEEAEEVYRSWKLRGGKIGRGDVGKAVAEGEHEHWRVQPRDADGQWVNDLIASSMAAHAAEDEKPTTRLQRTGRTQRVQRVQRVQRTQRAERAPLSVSRPQSTVTRPQSRISRSGIKALELALRKPPKQNQELPALDDRARYQVLRMSEFQARLDPDTVLSPNQLLRLTGPEHERFFGDKGVGPTMTGETVAFTVANNVERMVREKEGSLYDSYDEKRRPLFAGVATTDIDWDAVGARIRKIQERDPKIALINIVYDENNQYRVLASTQEVEDQVILEHDDDIDWTKPVEFTPIGVYQSTQMRVRRRDVPGDPEVTMNVMTDDSPTNARITYLRAHNAQVHRYRAGNP